MATTPYHAILTATSIRCLNRSYVITRQYINGIIVGGVPGEQRVACHIATAKGTRSLHPMVGQFRPSYHQGWIFPDYSWGTFYESRWITELRSRPALEWRRLLRPHLEPVPTVKIAIEDYSLDDLNLLRDRGWYAGRSLHAPLWRVYALLPVAIWESTSEFPRFDGQVRSVGRFGAIYDPRRHRLGWR